MTHQLPARIPSVDAGTLAFETGFPLKYVLSQDVKTELICAVCGDLPRMPVEVKNCGHFFCKSCILANIRLRSKKGSRISKHLAPCPNCRAPYDCNSIIPFTEFQATLQRLYKNILIKCPDCQFQGDPFRLDEHQIYECPTRKIQCPNYLCSVVEPAKEMEQHYKTCEQYRTNCPSCFLPVYGDNYGEHCCQNRQAEALRMYQRYFTVRSLSVPVLCAQGEPLSPIFVKREVDRLQFLKDLEPDLTLNESDDMMNLANDFANLCIHRASSPNHYEFIDDDPGYHSTTLSQP